MSLLDGLVLAHVAGGTVGLASGALALVARKGAPVHRAAGTAFFVAMLVMAGLGAVVGAVRGQTINVVAGSFTTYLVATAWLAVKRPQASVGLAERLLAAFIAVFVAAGGAATLLIAASPTGAADGVPWPAAAAFVAVAALAGALDLRVIRRGGLAGVARLSRHLWRMCLALAIAAAAFFLGQADEIPRALRGGHLAIPPLAALAALAFWMIRLRLGRAPRTDPAPAA
ncbi:MAG: hypothetical protein ACOY4K_15635 [Pseudomonadota bacterium]